VLQNDNNDDIWKPLKIPLRFPESVSGLKETKCNPIEISKTESGFLLYNFHHSQSKSFQVPLLQKKLNQIAGKIVTSLFISLRMSPLTSFMCFVALAHLTKTNKDES